MFACVKEWITLSCVDGKMDGWLNWAFDENGEDIKGWVSECVCVCVCLCEWTGGWINLQINEEISSR